MEHYLQIPTVESLYLRGLSISQLQSLLPCYRPDVEKVIKNYIQYLKKNNNIFFD